MKTKTLLLFAVFSFFLLACHKNDDEPDRINTQTVIFFFPYSADIMKEVNLTVDFDADILDGVQRLDGYRTPVFYDFGDYVARLCNDRQLLARFAEQMSKTVPCKAHTECFYSEQSGEIRIDSFSGLSVSPPTESNIWLGVLETAWWRETDVHNL